VCCPSASLLLLLLQSEVCLPTVPLTLLLLLAAASQP
jgi:hypothetical protein